MKKTIIEAKDLTAPKISVASIKAFVKKYPGESLLVLGVGIFVCNIFGFSYDTDIVSGSTSGIPNMGIRTIQGVAYYYPTITAFLISIGAMMIVAGVIIMKARAK
ncbi:MAG: hypothetical protein NTY04_03165 [Candidatus Staskawiczbacteria bacterium]|nr:hypothetical protein [Candidatus Staskawiczbacteria bacterium]